MSTDTITAIGTALSNSGISIIRISGKDSLNIINVGLKRFTDDVKLQKTVSFTVGFFIIIFTL